VSPLLNNLTNPVTKQIANKKFHTGTLNNHEVIILETGVGKVNAAIGTTLLQELYQPEYIINTGCAGGFDDSLEIGDIVLSSEVRYHDVDLTIFGYEFGQMSKMPAYFAPDIKLLNIATKSASILNFNIKHGLIASGDVFIHSAENIAKIKERFPKIYAAEMEACAIAHVCHLFKIPFLIIRSISDVVNKPNNTQSYEEFLLMSSDRSAKVITGMLGLI
jgi:adenosylhomocysteine nucleosidase